jgi:UDP-2-acetamido-3-amino-2,3-dideoxy-glucuronate N-acetyltransferase
VPSYALMAGVPARRIGWMCQCGERLADEIGTAVCGACGSKYLVTKDTVTALGEEK